MAVPQRILIIRLSSLGDIIHTLPALVSLRSAFPAAHIDWLVEARNRFLLSAVGGIDEILVTDTRSLMRAGGRRQAWRLLARTIRTLRARRYDAALDFQGLLKTALLCRLSGARRRIGFSRALVRERPAHWFYTETLDRASDSLHVIQLNLELARLAGGEPGPARPQFQIDLPDREAVEQLLDRHGLRRFVVINPGGGWPSKCWQPARYGALADRLQRDLGLQVAVTTGPGEQRLYEALVAGCAWARPAHLQVPFLQLIPLLSRARMFIGGDTGPLHLACALGVPVVAIFGPTLPLRNGPHLTPSEVVWHPLHCSGCYGRSCPTGNECLEISVDEVFEAVAKCLERTG